MKEITIIGGGLAGLTLGIALRREGVPVTVCEAGSYPRHRVCGEFISGCGLASLHQLGLLQHVQQAGVHRAVTASFFSARRNCATKRLPEPAVCISRFVLDPLLAGLFCEAGGGLRTNCRWTRSFKSEAIVRASGRRPQPHARGFRWYGLKAHAKNIGLTADLEMHFSQDAYIGMCRLGDGSVNVCGLFRRAPGRQSAADADMLQGQAGTVFAERVGHAEWDYQSFSAVGGLPAFPELATEDCCVGDALAMPAPLTGNGMSMAFEAAELAAEPLRRYACGTLPWDDAVNEIHAKTRTAFRARLRWSAILHRILFHDAQPLLLRVALAYGWPWLFRATR